MESKQMQNSSIIWNYLATKQEFFFTKVAPVQSVVDIVLMDFWLILLPFISFSTIFRKVYILFSNDSILVNMVFERCYLFFGCEIGHPLSMYDT